MHNTISAQANLLERGPTWGSDRGGEGGGVEDKALCCKVINGWFVSVHFQISCHGKFNKEKREVALYVD